MEEVGGWGMWEMREVTGDENDEERINNNNNSSEIVDFSSSYFVREIFQDVLRLQAFFSSQAQNNPRKRWNLYP